jgi:antitoxin (DNA-binding transcriptional repressor) of toxin-antitoxin stability system
MKVATVADLRNKFAQVSRWIEDGEKVEIRKRGKVFATLSPPTASKRKKGGKKKLQWPDFMARLKKIYPKVPPGKPISEILSEARGEW